MTDVPPHEDSLIPAVSASGDIVLGGSCAMAPSWPPKDPDIRRVFDSMYQDGSWGRYHGPHCDALRAALAEFHDVEHALLCSSGTAAVELALRAVNVRPGDEVILAAYDYKANFSNVLTVGAVPVLVDTEHGLPVPDSDQIRGAITEQTRAIICSHLHGCLAPIDRVLEIAHKHDVAVIEDACQSPGATRNGVAAGAAGDVGVLSFGGSKLLTAGRGGALLVRDPVIAQRIRLYSQRGNDAYPLSEMQAAVLLPQLRKLRDRNDLRYRNVKRLLQSLPPGGPLSAALNTDFTTSENLPAFYKVALRWESTDGPPRDEFAAVLRSRGVALDPAFPALHRIHSQRRFRVSGELPNATALPEQLLTLHHPVLLQQEDVIDQVSGLLTAP